MKVTFWLLDLNYEVRNDAPEVQLWGVTDSGERVLVIDKSFVAYFYTLLEQSVNPEKVIKEIKEQHSGFVSDVEVVSRRFFGKPVKAVKVSCKNPDGMPKIAREVRKLEGVKDCLEDDIRFSMRYLIDNNIVPCGWHEVDATEMAEGMNAQVDRVYTAISCSKLLERTDIPKLKILGFSPVYYSREGSPKSDRNPVIIISIATNTGQEKQLLATEDRDDKPILEGFIDYARTFNPDIIVGYGVNSADWMYLKERCKKHGLRLHVDRTETEPHTSVYGHVSVTGRANVDLADYAGEFQEVKVKTLENLADYLGIMKRENRKLIEDTEIADYWEDRSKRKSLAKYSQDNAQSIIGVANAVLDFSIQLSNLVSLPLDHVGTAAAGFRVEWFLIKRTHKIGELVPKKIEQPYRPYAGAIVIKPSPGLHENVADLDFKSMYPNLMIRYNLSPDTYVPLDEPIPQGRVYEAPEVKHRFRKTPPGFYKEILVYLIKVRGQIRDELKKIEPRSAEYRVFDGRQKAVKIITNAAYGYAGWVGARWYMKPVAESAAAWGRHTIMTSIKMAEEVGLKIVYGDTDSIFVSNDTAKIEKLKKQIGEKLGLEIDIDKVYVRIFFTEAKKRYAGLLPDGRLEIVGLEVVRGDWAEIAKEVQEKVLEIVLKEKSPKKAADFVHQFIYELRQKRVPLRDLIIWKTLTKPTDEYAVKASHVEAARMLKEKGWELSVGDKVGYVVVAGSGRLYERVKPYVFATYDEIDVEYYISKQVVPAAARVLASFGLTEEQLLGPKSGGVETKRLTEFFGS